MVLGYACPEHGFHRECSTTPNGERTCPNDGTDIAVKSIVGYSRKAPVGGTITGDIEWIVKSGYGPSPSTTVSAFDVQDAFEAARKTDWYEQQDGPISEIAPQQRSLRN